VQLFSEAFLRVGLFPVILCSFYTCAIIFKCHLSTLNVDTYGRLPCLACTVRYYYTNLYIIIFVRRYNIGNVSKLLHTVYLKELSSVLFSITWKSLNRYFGILYLKSCIIFHLLQFHIYLQHFAVYLDGTKWRIFTSLFDPGLLRIKVYSAFHPCGVGKWVPAAAGKAKTGMAHSACGWNAGCAGKTDVPWQCVPHLIVLEIFHL